MLKRVSYEIILTSVLVYPSTITTSASQTSNRSLRAQKLITNEPGLPKPGSAFFAFGFIHLINFRVFLYFSLTTKLHLAFMASDDRDKCMDVGAHNRTDYRIQQFDNNFKLIRFIAAMTVCCVHPLWVVHGLDLPDLAPINFLVQVAGCAVCVFFAMSRFLIASSLNERPGLIRFTVARIFRLCHLLFFVSLIVAFILGPLVTDAGIGEYYGDWRLWAYVPVTTLTYPDMTLPGVFENLPDPSEINISIWTLRYEILGYIALALIAATGLLQRKWYGVIAGLGLLVYLTVTFGTDFRSQIPFINHSLKLGLAFLYGSLLYVYREKVPVRFDGVVALIALAYFTNDLIVMEPIRIAAIAYTTVWVAFAKTRFLEPFKEAGDYSYGLFVIHWPIAQTLILVFPALSYPELIFLIIPLALSFAFFSWHFIEAPMIKWAAHWSDKFNSIQMEPPRPDVRYLTYS